MSIYNPRLKLTEGIIGIIVFATIVYLNAAWLSRDQAPVSWDFAVHSIESLQDFETFTADVPLYKKVSSIYKGSNGFYPPIFHIASVPLQFWQGSHPDTIAMANLIFIAILLFALLRLCSFLKAPTFTFPLAFVTAMSLPLVLELSREQMADFAQAALTVWAIAEILNPRLFTSWRAAAFAGFVFGLSMLAKWNSIFFVFPVFATLFVRHLHGGQWAPALRTAGSFCVTSGTVFFPWYLYWTRGIMERSSAAGWYLPIYFKEFFERLRPAEIYSFYCYLFNTNVLIFILMIVGVASIFFAKPRSPEGFSRKLLAGNVTLQFFLWHFLVQHRSYRHYLALAIMATFCTCLFALEYLKSRNLKLRTVPLIIILMTSITQLVLHFTMTISQRQIHGRWWSGFDSKIQYDNTKRALWPDQRRWPQQYLIELATQDFQNTQASRKVREPRIALYPKDFDEYQIDPKMVTFYALLNKADFSAGRPQYLLCTKNCWELSDNSLKEYGFDARPTIARLAELPIPDSPDRQNATLSLYKVVTEP